MSEMIQEIIDTIGWGGLIVLVWFIGYIGRQMITGELSNDE